MLKTKKETKSILKTKNIEFWCWVFLMPTIILYILFQAWPILASFYYAMLDFSGLSSNVEFIGFQNFIEVATDSYFWNAYLNSFKLMLFVVPLQLIFALILALVLNNETLKGVSIYRTLFFLPVITTTSIIGIVMIFIWATNGPVNALLMKLGIIHLPINFLGDIKWGMKTIILIYVWKELGTNMIYWLAGLQSVPKELLEAARVDGANKWQTFKNVTLPLILPIGGVIALLNVVGSLRVFDLIKTMTEGGPFFSTDVVATYIYRYAFSSEMGLPRLGYASAAGIFFGITVIIVAVIAKSLSNKFKKDSMLS